MKPYPILLLTLLILIALQATAQPARFNLQDLNQIACKEQTGQAQFAQKQASAAAIANDVCNITYARTHWNIDPAINYISGSVTYYFLPLTANFDTLYLDLSDSLTVDSVIYHAQNLPFSQADTELLYLLFSDALPTNTLDSVSIYYQGAPPQTGFGSFIQTDHNGTPIIWTLSEPYGASDWWPCKDDLSDKIDSLDAIITCPSGYRAAGNGILLSETSTPTQTICHWQHRHPIATYLVATAVTNYAAYTDLVPFGTDTVPMLNYVYPENLDEAIPLTADQIKVMQLYDSLFIVYPFKNEKYGHAQFSWGGGMEHQTMSFVVNFGFELLAHEMAHQWFGDHVTCGSWQDIWLNEGFATYLSGLCYEHLFGGIWWMPFKTGRINAITSQPDGSVWCSDTTDVNRIFNGRLSYAKGAMVLHQLRWIIGDQAFFTALRNYLNDPELAGGFARTQNLISHFEATSGQDLDWYFDDWFYGQGFPSYEIGWYFPQPDSTHLGIAVIQTQSHPSVSFFEMPLPIRVFYNGGQDTLLRVNLTDIGEPAQFFNYTLPYAADSIQFDPDKWLITNNNEVYFLIVDGTNPLTQAGNLRLYPNPAHATLVVDAGQQNINRIEVFNITGNLLMQVPAANTARQTLSTDALPPGLYWVKAYTNTGVQVQKFVKQ